MDKRTILQITGLPKTSFYYREQKPKLSQQDIKDFKWRYRIESILLKRPYYGHRRVTAQLKRQGHLVNKKRIKRLLKKFGLSARQRKKFQLPGDLDKIYPNLLDDFAITRPNQVWALDITFIITPEGVFYLFAIIDCFTRKIAGWTLSKNYTADTGRKVLKLAMQKQKLTTLEGIIHHSDQGIPYRAKQYTNFLKEQKAAISMSRKATPTDNPFIESFFKTLKYDEVYLKDYQSFKNAYSNIKEFIENDYNTERLHSALGNLPPVEFEQNYFNQQRQKLILENPVKNERAESLLTVASSPR